MVGLGLITSAASASFAAAWNSPSALLDIQRVVRTRVTDGGLQISMWHPGRRIEVLPRR
jgi:hypothetical protein